MAQSKKIRIRFTKNDNNKDFELSKEERDRIKDMYIMFNGSLQLRDVFNTYIDYHNK